MRRYINESVYALRTRVWLRNAVHIRCSCCLASLGVPHNLRKQHNTPLKKQVIGYSPVYIS